MVLDSKQKNMGNILKRKIEIQERNREDVLAEVTKNGWALCHAPEELRADREIVLAAVTQNGRAFCFAAEELKADREVVLVAVTQGGGALLYAAKALMADREIVLAAVTQDGSAFCFVTNELKADREIILAALSAHNLEQDSALYELIPMKLWGDEEITLRLIEIYGDGLPLTFLFYFIQNLLNPIG